MPSTPLPSTPDHQIFGRYSRSSRPLDHRHVWRASRVQNGELVDHTTRPPERVVVPPRFLRLFTNGRTQLVQDSVSDVIGSAESFFDHDGTRTAAAENAAATATLSTLSALAGGAADEPEATQPPPGVTGEKVKQGLREFPLVSSFNFGMRPSANEQPSISLASPTLQTLSVTKYHEPSTPDARDPDTLVVLTKKPTTTTAGLPLKQFPLISSPNLGVRPVTSQKLPLPEWQSLVQSDDASLPEPSSSPALSPDRRGTNSPPLASTWSLAGMGSPQSPEALVEAGPTDWSKQNVFARRTCSFKERRLQRNQHVPVPKQLYAAVQLDKKEDEEWCAQFNAVKAKRRNFQLSTSGMTKASVRRREAAQARWDQIHDEQTQDRATHLEQHRNRDLAYYIAFHKFDVDKSGSIDLEELAGALRHMGLRVPPEEVKTILDKYDDDGNGELSFAEFKVFAREAQLDPQVESLIISKEILNRSTIGGARDKKRGRAPLNKRLGTNIAVPPAVAGNDQRKEALAALASTQALSNGPPGQAEAKADLALQGAAAAAGGR